MASWNRVSSHLLFLRFFFAFYRSAICAPISRTRHRSAPIGPDVSSGCLVKDSADPARTPFGFAFFSSVFSATLCLLSARPQACCFSKRPGDAAENINGGLKPGEGRAHFSVFHLTCPVRFVVGNAQAAHTCSHFLLVPVQPDSTCWLFCFFVFCGFSINSSR